MHIQLQQKSICALNKLMTHSRHSHLCDKADDSCSVNQLFMAGYHIYHYQSCNYHRNDCRSYPTHSINIAKMHFPPQNSFKHPDQLQPADLLLHSTKAFFFKTRQVVFDLHALHFTNLPQFLLHIPFPLKVTLPLLLYVTAAEYCTASMLCN